MSREDALLDTIKSLNRELAAHRRMASDVNELFQKVHRPYICMDCVHHNAHPIPDPCPTEYVCPHWDPEHYVSEGWQQHWGDAAVNAWPFMTILRKEEEQPGGVIEIRYVILAPCILRRPVEIYASSLSEKGITSWGSY